MENITEAEAELYDRQIRLWGLDAQRRLRAATVLLIGMKGLGAEVAKNIILCGVKSITLMDNGLINAEDQMSQFFVSSAPVGQNRAEASAAAAKLLNPMVSVNTNSENPVDKEDAFFTQFDVIVATGCTNSFLCRLDKLCFQNNMKFYCGDVFGFYGYTFADLGVHEYLHEQEKKKKAKEGEENKSEEPETVVTKETVEFSRLEDNLAYRWDTEGPEMRKKLRGTPTAYFILRVYQEFLESCNRRPSLSSVENDTKQLQNLRLHVLDRLGAPPKVIPEDFFQFGFGELSPVCAVVGGVLAQEVIKAISQKDAPLNNFFVYNGVNDDGMVTKISS